MNKKNIGTHLIFWGAYILYEILISYFAGLNLRAIYTVLSFIINAAVFYSAWLAFTLVKEHVKSIAIKTVSIFFSTLLILAISTVLKVLIEMVVYQKDITVYLTKIQLTALVMRSLYFYLIGIGFSFARLAEKRNKQIYQYNLEKLIWIQEQDRLKKEAYQAELNLIKSQINPHFVFNTLGFLHAKTYKALPDVSKSILMLSNIMRHALTGSEDGYSTLESELSYIHDFIKIHHERNESLFIEYTLGKNTSNKKVISLILITLVENIFKHGILKKPSQVAILKIEVKGNKIYFYSFNHKNTNSQIQSNKIGIQYVKQRLNEVYPNSHQLVIAETIETYECKLTFPLETYETN